MLGCNLVVLIPQSKVLCPSGSSCMCAHFISHCVKPVVWFLIELVEPIEMLDTNVVVFFLLEYP